MSNTNFPNVFPSTDPETETQDFTAAVSFLDGSLSIKNTAAPTKIAQFSAAGITAGQTRVMTVPDYNATLATLAGTETLTNKTLTSPTLTTPVLGVATCTSLKATANVGTANTGTTAVEYGDAYHHTTVLTVNTTLPAIAGGADLAVGKLLYTLPAGVQIIDAAYMTLAITQTQGNITADTPDGGLGTVIGSGAVATLDGTGTFENILTGQTFNDCNGTAEVKTTIPTAAVPLVIESGGAKTIYFNVADGWAASGDAAALLVGTVVLSWRTLA